MSTGNTPHTEQSRFRSLQRHTGTYPYNTPIDNNRERIYNNNYYSTAVLDLFLFRFLFLFFLISCQLYSNPQRPTAAADVYKLYCIQNELVFRVYTIL